LANEEIIVASSFLGENHNSNYVGDGRMDGAVPIMSLLLVIGIVVTLLLVVVLRKRKREGKAGETDYRAFFIMGVAFLPTGFAMMIVYFLVEIPFEVGLPLFALGLIYLIIGLVNRDKWKKSE
jgi:drug/metabolite transporter (DMT)-like permease